MKEQDQANPVLLSCNMEFERLRDKTLGGSNIIKEACIYSRLWPIF